MNLIEQNLSGWRKRGSRSKKICKENNMTGAWPGKILRDGGGKGPHIKGIIWTRHDAVNNKYLKGDK